MTDAALESLISELMNVLDADIECLQDGLSILDEMRSLVVKRDEAALRRMLERIRLGPGGQDDNAARRTAVRSQIAALLGWRQSDVTLTRLMETAPAMWRSAVAEKRERLIALTGAMQREYSKTALLLSECSRFNRVLLRRILELGGVATSTYTAQGVAKPQAQAAFMNMQF